MTEKREDPWDWLRGDGRSNGLAGPCGCDSGDTEDIPLQKTALYTCPLSEDQSTLEQ